MALTAFLLFPQGSDSEEAKELSPAPAETGESPENDSIELCIAGLKAGARQAEIFSLLTKVIELEKNPYLIEPLVRKYLPEVKDSNERGILLERLAILEELYGALDDARRDYETASECFSGRKKYDLLLVYARLCIELGMYPEAQAALDVILAGSSDEETVRDALRTRTEIILDSQGARAAYASFKEKLLPYGIESLRLEDLTLYLAVLLALGDKNESDRIAEIIGEKYKNAPELIFLSSGSGKNTRSEIMEFPSPGRLVEEEDAGIETDGVKAKTDEKSEPGDKTSACVQAGSFKMKENADYLRVELESSGFASRILKKNIRDSILYVVIVEPKKEDQNPQTLLLALKKKGFEGFITSGL